MAPWWLFLLFGVDFVLCENENTTEVRNLEVEERNKTTTISPQQADDDFADSLVDELKLQANLRFQFPLEYDIEPIAVGDVSFLTGGQFKGLSSMRREGHTRRHDNDTLIIPAVLENTQTIFNWTFSYFFLFTKSGKALVRSAHMPITLHVRTGPERLAHFGDM
uniref:Uncharacterized protein n=1 Tax=Strigamia maritima TaxID=126957 RepID=T1IS62_STRMM